MASVRTEVKAVQGNELNHHFVLNRGTNSSLGWIISDSYEHNLEPVYWSVEGEGIKNSEWHNSGSRNNIEDCRMPKKMGLSWKYICGSRHKEAVDGRSSSLCYCW